MKVFLVARLELVAIISMVFLGYESGFGYNRIPIVASVLFMLSWWWRNHVLRYSLAFHCVLRQSRKSMGSEGQGCALVCALLPSVE